jgi:hypothetical protein
MESEAEQFGEADFTATEEFSSIWSACFPECDRGDKGDTEENCLFERRQPGDKG